MRSSAPRQFAARTINDRLYIVHKTLNDSQGLRGGHAGLFLRESVQSLQYGFDLSISQ